MEPLQSSQPKSTKSMVSLPACSRWLNCFQYCSHFLRALGHAMVLLVLGLVALSYWSVFGISYGPSIFTGNLLLAAANAVAVLAVTGQVFMLLWTYFVSVLTDPGRVPPEWHPFQDEQQARYELERMSYSDYYFDRRDPRRPRYCKRCQAWKPERTHHCKVLGRCVLKMDHYCIWILNCVGLLNYKFFLQFMVYACAACLTVTLLMLKPMIQFLKGRLHGPSVLICFLTAIVNGTLTISLVGSLALHLRLIWSNCTTIEMFEKDRIYPWPYNRGLKRNLLEVFGRSKRRWFVPVMDEEEIQILLDSCLNPSSMKLLRPEPEQLDA